MAFSLTGILNLRILDNTLQNFILFFAVLTAAIIAGKLLYRLCKTTIRALTQKTKTKLDDILVDMLEEPLVFAVFIFGLYIALGFLTVPSSWSNFINKGFKVLIIINIIWFIARFIDSMIEHYLIPVASKTETDIDDQIMPILRKVVGITIWSVGIIFLLSNLGVNITSLVAGLGIGGIAIAFAVKDLLAHMFGGITVLTDKPFKVGQRIRVDKYDGTVKEIGIRSTKIVTLDGTELVVPNGVIADSIVENVSREEARKIKMTVGVEYSTSVAKLQEAKKVISDIILKNKSTKDESIVTFNEFGPSSLDISIIYWIKDISQFLQVKDEINIEIKKAFEKAKIEFAFPTQTIHLKK